MDQTLDDIFKQFFDMENYLNNSDKLAREWIVVKLVTIIEQVCRKIISNQIDTNNVIKLPESLIGLEYREKTSISDLIASQYNFQNSDTIINVFNTYEISGIFDKIKKEHVDKLFNIRHNIVHSVSEQQYDIKQLYAITQSLLKSILNKSSYGLSYYDVFNGDYFVGAKKFGKAIDCYNDAIMMDNTNIVAYFCLGSLYYRTNDVKMVHEYSTKMINFNSKTPYGYLLKGLAFEKEKKHENAICCYNKAINLKPDLVVAHYQKGYSLLNMNKPIDALLCGYTVMTLDPNNVEIIISVATVLNQLDMCNESLNLLNRYISRHPDNVEAYVQKCDALSKLGRIDESKQCFDEIIRLNPKAKYRIIPPNDKKENTGD